MGKCFLEEVVSQAMLDTRSKATGVVGKKLYSVGGVVFPGES